MSRDLTASNVQTNMVLALMRAELSLCVCVCLYVQSILLQDRRRRPRVVPLPD